MGTKKLLGCALAPLAILSCIAVAPTTATAGIAQPSIPSDVPAANTPQILDASTAVETVYDIQEVGNRIIVAGRFSRVQNAAANGGATVNRSNVFAFDANTGALDT